MGEFKDDQFQGHEHGLPNQSNSGWRDDGYKEVQESNPPYTGNWKTKVIKSDGTNGTPRYGTTTHGKQIGISYIIKVL